MSFALLLLATGALQGASAAAPTQPAMSVDELVKQGGTAPKVKKPPLLTYPDMSGSGAQGVARFSAIIGVDGHPHVLAIKQSAGAPGLDESARKMAEGITFEPGRDRSGKPIAVETVISMEMWKDTMDPGAGSRYLPTKGCGEFVTDADWYVAHAQGAAKTKMRVWLLATGALFIAEMRQKGADAAVKSTRAADFDKVYDYCKAHPDERFMVTLGQFRDGLKS